MLILNETLNIGNNKEKNCAVFSLAHSNRLSMNQNRSQNIIAINDDMYWVNVRTK